MSDIWHTGKEIPDEDRYIVIKNYAGLYSAGSEFEYNLDHVEKWAYFDDLLEFETENKDLSDKIGKLETELDRTRKALDVAVDALKEISLLYSEKRNSPESVWAITAIDMAEYADTALEQITALEQKDVK